MSATLGMSTGTHKFTPRCGMAGCDFNAAPHSAYCQLHQPPLDGMPPVPSTVAPPAWHQPPDRDPPHPTLGILPPAAYGHITRPLVDALPHLDDAELHWLTVQVNLEAARRSMKPWRPASGD